MRLHRQMQPVVGLTRQPDRADRVEPVRAGGSLRDDLNVHACLVHLANAQLSQIQQAVTHLARTRFGSIKLRRNVGIPIVFFDRDDTRLAGFSHGVLSGGWLQQPRTLALLLLAS